ncbi:MAG: hypothetical protein Q9220_004543 [cf. Caloplaca sp. 1 TL-2023]
MRIATLQFSPELGLVDDNIEKANSILSSAPHSLRNLDLLVLPELAFTGYNHASLSSITPYLEDTASGPSTQWAFRTARRLNCLVSVGYPELFSPSPPPRESLKPTMIDLGLHREIYYKLTAYNSTVTVNPSGEVVAHYRKTNLYYTDEIWAQESPNGFTTTELNFSSLRQPLPSESNKPPLIHKTTFAICMDLNSYHFLPPSISPPCPLATHILTTNSTLLVLSTAWLTHLPSSSLKAEMKTADLDTLACWVDCLLPILRDSDKEVICVFANRCGEEGGKMHPNAKDDAEEGVRYAGSSWIGKAGKGEAVIGGIMGRGEEGVLVVETDEIGVKGDVWRVRLREDEDTNEEAVSKELGEGEEKSKSIRRSL